MKDEALKSAIEYVGSQTKLAKQIGTTQASVSRWSKVPAEYVLRIEEATQGHVSRHALRPDIYPAGHQ